MHVKGKQCVLNQGPKKATQKKSKKKPTNKGSRTYGS